MLALDECPANQVFDCVTDIIDDHNKDSPLAPALDVLAEIIFMPIADSIADAIGKTMTAMATFWVDFPTPAVGNAATGEPVNTVDWLWQHTQWLAIAIGTVSIMVAGCRMAWTQRGEALRDILRALLTMAMTSFLAIAVIQTLSQVGDAYSSCIINTALDNTQTGWTCNFNDADARAFGDMMTRLLLLGGATGQFFLIITFGIITILASLVQLVLMFVRNAIMVVAVGVLPLAGAASATPAGRGWVRRLMTWIAAALLYKPVAATIYATCIELVEPDGPLALDKDGNPRVPGNVIDPNVTLEGDIISVATGVTMMVLAIFAMPALMRLLAPAVAAVTGGDGAGVTAINAARRVEARVGRRRGPAGAGPAGGAGRRPGSAAHIANRAVRLRAMREYADTAGGSVDHDALDGDDGPQGSGGYFSGPR